MDRLQLAQARDAGYHMDRAALAKISSEAIVPRLDLARAYKDGVGARVRGIRCGCATCLAPAVGLQ